MSASHCWRNSKTRLSRLAKNRLRYVRRIKMNARSNPSATMAAMMALKTKAAGPSLQSFLKMDPIAQSETRVRPVLRTPLIAAESRQILTVCNLQPQSAAVSLRGETTDLIHDGEIFRAYGE